MKKCMMFLCFALVLALFAGCAAPAAELDAPSSSATAEPTPSLSPSPSFGQAELSALCADFSATPDVSGVSFESSEQFDYETVVGNIPAYEEIAACVKAAYEQAAQDYEEEIGVAFQTEVETPDWKYVAAVAQSQGNDPTACAAVLANGAIVSGTMETGVARISVTWPEFSELMEETAGEEANEYMSGRFLYSYLKTVYDENGEECAFVSGPLPEDLTMPITDMEIRNTWYNDRSKGTRKHTGMDIRSPEDTPIYACKAGRVLYVGSNEGAGNYVVIAGEDGFEYHYYHMVRLSTQVKRGDTVEAGEEIGNVGNTGNSDANHLHLTIVGKDGAYINPYDCFKGEEA